MCNPWKKTFTLVPLALLIVISPLQLLFLSHIVYLPFQCSKVDKEALRTMRNSKKIIIELTIWDEPIKKVQL
jgi:hypothetical protein